MFDYVLFDVFVVVIWYGLFEWVVKELNVMLLVVL